MQRNDVRNIAIIAHVDHGKTTLVDSLLKQAGVFRENQVLEDRVMDSGDIEKERGITILSKNTSVTYDDIKINIIDTPGHADFGGEVERVLKMVNGVILVVDAFEGPMPQTKFVLKNALDLELPVVVCINKIDREGARPLEVIDDVLELFMELDASDDQFNSPFVFASAKNGTAFTAFDKNTNFQEGDMRSLFTTIINHIPAPIGDENAEMQTLISTIDYSEYVGRIGIGKVENGIIKVNDEVVVLNVYDPNKNKKVKITRLYEFEGLKRVEVNQSKFGSIVAVVGIEDIHIGDTISSLKLSKPLDFVKISEPTITMNFIVTDSPFAGQDGKYVTSRNLRDRLFKELNTDVSLRVEETSSTDIFKVSGRGELHLSILIETMRREGYEFQVSKPEVLLKTIDDVLCEPMEVVTVDVPAEFTGTVIEKLGQRRGELTVMSDSKSGYTRLVFNMPARGLIGYRQDFLTDTKGSGILNTVFDCYAPYKGDIVTRKQGSLVAFEAGEAVTYGLYNAQERGELFITPSTKVYQGMIVGRSSKNLDIDVNVCKRKQLTNMRSSGADDALRLVTPITLSLEQSLDFITDDELVEVTPTNLRLRKKILDTNQRLKAKKK